MTLNTGCKRIPALNVVFNQCHLLLGIMQCYICLLYIPYFINKCRIGCLDIKELAFVENYAQKRSYNRFSSCGSFD
jgi:hypothetical protein